MTLSTRLIAVRDLKAGDNVGYGGRFTCPEDMRIGVAALGYGDGYPRVVVSLPVLVDGILTQTLSTASMDMLAIDLRPCPLAQLGSAVEAWGENLPVGQVAMAAGHIDYDLLTGVHHRVQSIWLD